MCSKMGAVGKQNKTKQNGYLTKHVSEKPFPEYSVLQTV